MVEPDRRRDETRLFDVLGLSEQEELVYLRLLNARQAGVSLLARDLRFTANKTQRLLDAIEAKGLATHSPERPRRYFPVSPDIALEALALRRQDDLRRAREAIGRLQEQVLSTQSRTEQDQIIELITSPQAIFQTFEHLQRTARKEVLALIRPPLLISRLEAPSVEDREYEKEALVRGVRYRAIVDADFMALPGAVQRVREDMEAGEEYRVVSRLPFKMVLADWRLAFIPLNFRSAESPSLLVRSSPLLDALYALFEMLWERATVISFTHAGLMETDKAASRFPAEAEDMVSLMMAGLNDKRIAGELGISASTLTRRISELMLSFDARTRFQLGCLITRHSLDNNDK